jgi:protein pelota
MRVIYKDLKHGRVKLTIETLDDLWHLQHLVEPGDIAASLTWRRERAEVDKLRPERPKKKPIKLSIKVESVEFHKFANRLRLLGTIIEGPDMGKHHAFSLEPGSTLTITKAWRPDHLDRLREAVRASRRPRVLLVAMDDESAELGLVRQYGLERLGTIYHRRVGKLYVVKSGADELKFFHKLATTMNEIILREGVRAAVVAGPGFTKNSFAAFLREAYPELANKVRTDDISSSGRAGLYEIIRRGLVERVSAEDRISFETALVQELMEKIAKGGLATYGRAEVERASSAGAVKKLLIADELLRQDRAGVEEVLERVRRARGDVVIVSTEHEAGQQLLALKGIAALLRFKPERTSLH